MMRRFLGLQKTMLLLGLLWALMPQAFAVRHWSTGTFGFDGEGSDTVQVTFKMSGSIPADRVQAQGGDPMICLTVTSGIYNIPLVRQGDT